MIPESENCRLNVKSTEIKSLRELENELSENLKAVHKNLKPKELKHMEAYTSGLAIQSTSLLQGYGAQ